MHLDRRAVGFCTANRNLEFTRQESEFRMESRPLAENFAPHQWVNDLVRRHTGQMINRRVADAIAAGLNGVHLHGGQFGQNLRHIFELGPVELAVLPRTEMAVAAIPSARDVSKRSQLACSQETIRNSNPQHGCKSLNIKAVLQP